MGRDLKGMTRRCLRTGSKEGEDERQGWSSGSGQTRLTSRLLVGGGGGFLMASLEGSRKGDRKRRCAGDSLGSRAFTCVHAVTPRKELGRLLTNPTTVHLLRGLISLRTVRCHCATWEEQRLLPTRLSLRNHFHGRKGSVHSRFGPS